MSSCRRRRRFTMKQPVAVADVGCSCRRVKLSALLSSLRLKPHPPKTPHSLSSPSSSLWPSSTASSSSATVNSSSFSLSLSSHEEEKKKGKREKRRNRGVKKANWSAAAESVAVVKDSSEPYADFRESMVQMIVEKDLYAWDELNDLLHRFLSLNSPRHHNLILHAFADLWSGVFSPPSPCRWENYY